MQVQCQTASRRAGFFVSVSRVGLARSGAVLSRVWPVLLMGAAPLPAAAAEDFLPPEQAFVVSAALVSAGRVEVRVQIVAGYYAYREPFRFSALGATSGPAELPAGKVKFGENF